MDVKVGSMIVEDTPIMSDRVKSIQINKLFAADKGALSPGLVVGEDSARKGIPAALVNEADMTGLVNGTNKVFTYSLGRAVCPGTVVITHGAQVVTDDGFGHLVGDGTGTINYKNGAVSVTFTAAPADSSGSPVISLADDPFGILCNSVDTATGASQDSSGLVGVFGSAIFANIFMSGGDAVPAAVLDRLRVKGVYAE